MARKSRKNIPSVMAENPDSMEKRAVAESESGLAVRDGFGMPDTGEETTAAQPYCGIKLYHAAIYARLSFETEANRERETIDTQICYLKNFIDRKGDMELAGIYADV